MLIQALCAYYDMLAKSGKALPPGYSSVKIHYLVCLTPDGKIDEIINWQNIVQRETGKGKFKEQYVPREIMLPQRTEKSGIDANILEHKPLHLFGLNFTKDGFTPEDRTEKAKKSHAAFVQANMDFLEGLDSPGINAYRNFIANWKPEEETENPYLLHLGKGYSSARFAFCLSGRSDLPLHTEEQIQSKWAQLYGELQCSAEDGVLAQCAVSGEKEPIARIHDKIKGVPGGNSSSSVLICFKNASENSYGNNHSYNSNISQAAMKKYTEALNYLLNGKRHRALLDDVTVVYWAMSENEVYNDLASLLLFDSREGLDAQQTEEMLGQLMPDVREGSVRPDRIKSTAGIDADVDFYIVGIKPNTSRMAVKFIYRRKFGEILMHAAQHQCDLQITQQARSVELWRIKKEMISPKSKSETVNPALLSKMLESVLYGTNYPSFLLSTMVRRAKTDAGSISAVRAGVIKACINRKLRLSGQKEELKLALDKENNNPAYLCGRLFAVLEKLQQSVSDDSLNRTIKDAYFSSASSKPSIIFPKLLNLAQHHLNKSKSEAYYRILIGEIVDKLGTAFPDTLLLPEQGRFIIGYYQQYQSFFVKKEDQKTETTQEEL